MFFSDKVDMTPQLLAKTGIEKTVAELQENKNELISTIASKLTIKWSGIQQASTGTTGFVIKTQYVNLIHT